MEPSRSRSTTDALSRYSARNASVSLRSLPTQSRAIEMRDDLELIAKAVERVPIVGPLWADLLQVVFGVADAMNLRRLRINTRQGVARDRKLVFLY